MAKRQPPAAKTEYDNDLMLIVADEMNEALGLDPLIDTSLEGQDLFDAIKAEAGEIQEGDAFSEDNHDTVVAWLSENGLWLDGGASEDKPKDEGSGDENGGGEDTPKDPPPKETPPNRTPPANK